MDASQMTPELIAALRQQVAAGASPYGAPSPAAPPPPGAAAPGPSAAPAAMGGRIPGLTPQTMHQLMSLGALDDQASALDEQMALANALRQGMGQKHSTGLGGAFGALGDAVNGYHAKSMMDDVRAGRAQLSQDRTSGREQLARLLGYGPQPAPGTGGEF